MARAPVTQQEEGFHQFLPPEAGHAAWVSCQSPTAQLFPAQKMSRLRPPLIGRAHRQGCRSFSTPPTPACSSCLSSCQEAGPGVSKGSPESWLLEDSLAGPFWISVPSSQRPGSHDYCGHSGGLCSEVKGWRESLRGKGIDLHDKKKLYIY